MYFALNNDYTCIKKELHIVNNLLIKVFIDINIMISKKMNINIKHETITINVCENMVILISIKIKNQTVHTSIFNKKRIIVSAHITMSINVISISIKLDLSCDRNFIFKSETLDKLSVYTHIININIISIFV